MSDDQGTGLDPETPPPNSKITTLDEARARAERKAWLAQLAHAPNGGFLGDERNVLVALRHAPELIGFTRFNEFKLNVELTRALPWRTAEIGSAWTEEDDTLLAAWLQQQGLKVRGPGVVGNCIAAAARDRPHHPVRDYLTALQWDGKARLKRWLAQYLEAQGDPSYLAAIGTCYMVSAVARILQPGCQVDHVLTLEAPQGSGKTSAARALAVRPEWFAGDLPEIHGKDARMQLLGHWIVEIAELKATRSAGLEAQKSFLTQTHDTFRPPYGRRTAQFPRQSVFIATTNEEEYLRDPTGNRRWWPVRCGQIQIPALVRDRGQLWAEAVHLYRAGTAWHLTGAQCVLAEQEQAERMHVSELELDVRQYLATLDEAALGRKPSNEVTVRAVLRFGLGLDDTKPGYAEAARKLGPAVAEALQRCGWKKDKRRGRDKRTTYVRG